MAVNVPALNTSNKTARLDRNLFFINCVLRCYLIKPGISGIDAFSTKQLHCQTKGRVERAKGRSFSKIQHRASERRELFLNAVAVFGQGGGFQPKASYSSFSPSSAMPIFESR